MFSLIKRPSQTIAKKDSESHVPLIQSARKDIVIQGKKYKVNAYQLMRMIKRITQNIGEYKEMETPYSAYIITSLRKARGDIVSDLEHYFHIYWSLDETGQSVFTVGQ
jgi:hypothetical protein